MADDAAVQLQPLHQNRYIVSKRPFSVEDEKLYLYVPAAFALSPHFPEGSDIALRPRVVQLLDAIELEMLGFLANFQRADIVNEAINRLPDIRSFYGMAQPDAVDDAVDDVVGEELARKMVKGACLLLSYISNHQRTEYLIEQYLGSYGLICFNRDIVMLGNQIPLWLITLLRPFQDCQDAMRGFFGNRHIFYQGIANVLPWGDGVNNMPVHYLDALHRVQFTFNDVQLPEDGDQWELSDASNRSATELVSKGIQFGTCSHVLRDIRFTGSGKLCLPTVLISSNFEILYSNLIAFEISPQSRTRFGVLSYIDFLKSLVQNNDDVKVLKEAKILYTTFSTDDDVVKALKSIDTFRMSTNDLLRLIKRRINRHCRNKRSTWMADLKNTHFNSPWTVIALFTAIFVIGLYVAQTVFAYLSLKK